MAITIKQQPNEIHSVYQNAYYVYQTSQTGVTGYYYLMYVNDIEGVQFAGNTAPLEDRLSMNYPNEILKNKTKFNFNPTCSEIENIPDNLYVYNESYEESVNITGVTYGNVKSACRYIDDDFIPTDYLIYTGSTTTDFLVKMPNSHNMRYEDYFTLRTFNGYLDSVDSGNTALLVNIGIEIKTDDRNFPIVLARLTTNNPYLGAAQSSTLSATTSGDNYMIELGVGIQNLLGVEIDVYGAIDSGGTTHTFTEISQPFNVIDVTGYLEYSIDVGGTTSVAGNLISYDIYGVYDTRDYFQASKAHTFTFYNDCLFDSINVAWENSIGGVDYYLFVKANEKTISTNKTTYDKNKYYLDVDNEEVTELDYNPRTTVYNNKVTTFIEAQTDWLTQDEINGLQGLFESLNVYIFYGGEWLSVISAEKKAVIYNKKRKGLKKYKLNFELSSKIIKN